MTDKEIVDLFFARSERAIDETNIKYGAYCRKISMNILKSREDCDEAINDTWLKAWNTIPPTMPNPLKTYLGMLTRRICLNRHEYNTAQKRNPDFEILLSEVEQILPARADDFEKGSIAPAVNEFLGGLKREQRVFFVKRYWYSCSVAEISRDCGVSQSKVKSSLFRTRNALREFLEKEGIL